MSLSTYWTDLEEEWIPKSDSIFVAGREVGGMVYIGRKADSAQYRPHNSSLINPYLKVDRRGDDYECQDMHYWPSYSIMDPGSRATYIDWLAGNRADTRYSPKYALLYFYGLERRVFVDQAEPWERAEIVAEVRRLLDRYRGDGLIDCIFGDFIEMASLLDQDYDPQPIFERHGRDIPARVEVALGRMLARRMPLTSDWLLSWFLCHPETSPRTPARRVFPVFRAYFKHLFDQKYPDGLKVRTPRRRLHLQYESLSYDFTEDLGELLGDVRDIPPNLSKKLLRVAQGIADESADGLDRYSRYLGRNPDGKDAIEAHALLPEALQPLFPCPRKQEFMTWAERRIESNDLARVEDIAEWLEVDWPDKVGKSQLIRMADRLARLGVGMAPDPRFTLGKTRWSCPVVLFHLPKSARVIESPSEPYQNAILKLMVVTLVACADGPVDTAGRKRLSGLIQANRSITPAERARLRADLTWTIATRPDIGMLRTRLRDAPENLRCALSRLAVATAGEDGAPSPKKIRAIERLYEMTGRDRGEAYADLHAHTSAAEPLAVHPADHTAPEFTIPSPASGSRADAVTLDAGRISRVMADTAHISRTLDDIFTDDGDQGRRNGDASASGEESDLEGLDASHRAVASALITRCHWTEDEIVRLADEHQLMAAGALETINEWAFNRFGDLLVEEYNGYEINDGIARQLAR